MHFELRKTALIEVARDGGALELDELHGHPALAGYGPARHGTRATGTIRGGLLGNAATSQHFAKYFGGTAGLVGRPFCEGAEQLYIG